MLAISSGIGIVISLYLKEPVSATAVGLLIYILIGFLSGQLFPVNIIDLQNVIKIISSIIPQRHIYDLLMQSLHDGYGYAGADHITWHSQL